MTVTLLELLSELAAVEVVERWTDGVLVAALLQFGAGRRLVVVERTYREGLHVLLDPTPEDLRAGKEGRLWDLWNAERAQFLTGTV